MAGPRRADPARDLARPTLLRDVIVTPSSLILVAASATGVERERLYHRGDGERLSGLGIYDEPGPCRDLYPLHGDPRTVAGAPLADDVLKCSLQPVAEAVEQGRYGQATEEQVTRLEVIFPDGVCDFSRPGVGQVPVEGVWLRYPR